MIALPASPLSNRIITMKKPPPDARGGFFMNLDSLRNFQLAQFGLFLQIVQLRQIKLIWRNNRLHPYLFGATILFAP